MRSAKRLPALSRYFHNSSSSASSSKPTTSSSGSAPSSSSAQSNATQSTQGKVKKTIAEQDAELQEKLAGRCGDAGGAAVEYEDGKPVAMKRSVRNNMFRYI